MVRRLCRGLLRTDLRPSSSYCSIQARSRLTRRTILSRTPLSWAAKNGCNTAVKLLLDIGKVETDSKDTHGRTPLSWAAGNGHEAVVKLLHKHLNFN